MLEAAAISYDNNRIYIKGELNFVSVVDVWINSLPLLDQCVRLSFDLSQVTAANSAALALLLEWIKYAKHHNKAIQFDHIPAQLLSIATVSGIETMLL
jgi:phospholipid transport system transporter-binding protein